MTLNYYQHPQNAEARINFGDKPFKHPPTVSTFVLLLFLLSSFILNKSFFSSSAPFIHVYAGAERVCAAGNIFWHFFMWLGIPCFLNCFPQY